MLKTDKYPSWDDAIDSVAGTFNVDTSVLNVVMQARNDEIKMDKQEMEELYNWFMSFVDEMVGIVDQLE